MKIVDFFNGGANDNGITLQDFFEMSCEEMEAAHDIIQWCFPLREESECVLGAPVITEEEIALFNAKTREGTILREKLDQVYWKWLRFFFYSENGFSERVKIPQWLTKKNHNYRRMTRLIKSLYMLGLFDKAFTFWRNLDEIYYPMYKGIIGEETKKFWDDAIQGN